LGLYCLASAYYKLLITIEQGFHTSYTFKGGLQWYTMRD